MRIDSFNINKKIVIIVMALLLTVTIGYALFTESLNISGSAGTGSANLNIVFDRVGQITEAEAENTTADIQESGKKLVINVPGLKMPTAYAKIPVTIKNKGDIVAKVKQIRTEGLDTTDIKVTYEGVEQEDIFNPNDEKELIVKVTWDESSTSTSVEASFSIEIDFEQVTGSGGGTTTSGEITPPKSQFEKDSWDTIANNVKEGNIDSYKLGDTKEVDLGEYGKHTVRIANTSTPEECNTEGFSQSACGFVLEFEDLITRRQINSEKTNKGGWPASEMYKFVNETLYNALPADLKGIIKETKVISGHGSDDPDNFTSYDKLYLVSIKEIYDSDDKGRDTSASKTRQLDYYKSKGVTEESYSGAYKYDEKPNNDTFWWTRSVTVYNYFYRVTTQGNFDLEGPNSSDGVSPAFRIG